MENKVRELRRSAEFDISQEKLAKAVNVSRGTISSVEKGGNLSGELMLRLSHFFKRDAREIFILEDLEGLKQDA